jgi:hypothetical protein
MPREDKVRDIPFKRTMLGFEEEYDEKKDNLKSYLKEGVMLSKTYLRINEVSKAKK